MFIHDKTAKAVSLPRIHSIEIEFWKAKTKANHKWYNFFWVLCSMTFIQQSFHCVLHKLFLFYIADINANLSVSNTALVTFKSSIFYYICTVSLKSLRPTTLKAKRLSQCYKFSTSNDLIRTKTLHATPGGWFPSFTCDRSDLSRDLSKVWATSQHFSIQKKKIHFRLSRICFFTMNLYCFTIPLIVRCAEFRLN